MTPNWWAEQEIFLCILEEARYSQDFGIWAFLDIEDKPQVSNGLFLWVTNDKT